MRSAEHARLEPNSTRSTLKTKESDYSDALLSDLDFGAFSHSALVRMADEVWLQMHLLNLSFVIAVGNGQGPVRPLQAIVTAVDKHLDVEVTGDGQDWTAHFAERGTEGKEFSEVSVVRVSGGASWEFEDRKSLPLTVLAEPGTRRPEPASSRRWRTAHDRNGG